MFAQIFNYILNELALESLRLVGSGYWHLRSSAAFSIERDPIDLDLVIGDLREDWAAVLTFLSNPATVGLRSDQLAALLRYVGEEVYRHHEPYNKAETTAESDLLKAGGGDLDVQKLRCVVDLICSHLIRTTLDRRPALDKNFHWEVPFEVMFKVDDKVNPAALGVGSMVDEWEMMGSLIFKQDAVMSYQLARLAPLLDYLCQERFEGGLIVLRDEGPPNR